MKIETKLNIGDTFFFLHEMKVLQSVVRGIKTETLNVAENAAKGEVRIETTIIYLFNKEPGQVINGKVEQKYSFKTKADLLKSL